jgi:hypothetical protein
MNGTFPKTTLQAPSYVQKVTEPSSKDGKGSAGKEKEIMEI